MNTKEEMNSLKKAGGNYRIFALSTNTKIMMVEPRSRKAQFQVSRWTV